MPPRKKVVTIKRLDEMGIPTVCPNCNIAAKFSPHGDMPYLWCKNACGWRREFTEDEIEELRASKKKTHSMSPANELLVNHSELRRKVRKAAAIHGMTYEATIINILKEYFDTEAGNG